MGLILLSPLEHVLDLRHAPNEVAPNEFPPAVAAHMAIPLILLFLSKLRLEDLGVEA